MRPLSPFSAEEAQAQRRPRWSRSHRSGPSPQCGSGRGPFPAPPLTLLPWGRRGVASLKSFCLATCLAAALRREDRLGSRPVKFLGLSVEFSSWRRTQHWLPWCRPGSVAVVQWPGSMGWLVGRGQGALRVFPHPVSVGPHTTPPALEPGIPGAIQAVLAPEGGPRLGCRALLSDGKTCPQELALGVLLLEPEQRW